MLLLLTLGAPAKLDKRLGPWKLFDNEPKDEEDADADVDDMCCCCCCCKLEEEVEAADEEAVEAVEGVVAIEAEYKVGTNVC